MIPLDRRTAIARHSQWLALALEALVLISLLASAIPLAPAQPVWWLRLSDAAVNLAEVLLRAVKVLRLGFALLNSDSKDAKLSGRRSHQLASRWAALGSRILASRSEAELGSLLATANPGPLPPLKAGSLAERKQQLSEAIAINS